MYISQTQNLIVMIFYHQLVGGMEQLDFCAGGLFVILGIVAVVAIIIGTVINFNNTEDFQLAKCRTVSTNLLPQPIAWTSV